MFEIVSNSGSLVNEPEGGEDGISFSLGMSKGNRFANLGIEPDGGG